MIYCFMYKEGVDVLCAGHLKNYLSEQRSTKRVGSPYGFCPSLKNKTWTMTRDIRCCIYYTGYGNQCGQLNSVTR